jgi:hypothetical protein
VTDPREPLGRLIREEWVKWASEQPDPKPSWLLPWEELDAGQREVDMRMGAAVAAAERERAAGQIARHVEQLAASYPEDVFPPGGESRDAISGTAMRHALLNAARSIREDWPELEENTDA